MNKSKSERNRANSVTSIKDLAKRKREENISQEEEEILAEIAKRNKKTARTPERKEHPKEQKQMESMVKAIRELREEVKALREEAQKGFKENKEEIAELKEEMKKREEKWEIEKAELKGRLEMLEMKQERQEKKEKKNNIVIRGGNFTIDNEKKGVEELFQKELKVEAKVQNVKRIGGDNAKMVIVEMESWEEKQKIMKRKNKLKDLPSRKTCYIDNDLTQKEEKIQKKIRDTAKIERNNGNSTKVGYQKLRVNDQFWRWDNGKGELVKAKN
jgi:DNA repair exonuclease SbcCD ATPase subunit